jgi:hypothetical protein
MVRYQSFGGLCRLHLHNTEGVDLNLHRHEDLRSRKLSSVSNQFVLMFMTKTTQSFH